MTITIPYGSKTVDIQIDGTRLIGVIEPALVESGDSRGLIEAAVAVPVKSVTLPDFLSAGKVLFIVNDATRPTPTAKVLDVIAEYLPEDVEFLVAAGTHRGPTEDEFRFIFGDHLEKFAGRIHVHDSWQETEMLRVGITAHGTDVKLNRRCIEAEKIVVIGSVEPHYFAGYTGGRKAFLPGTAAYSSIEQNHRHALDSASAPLALKGNPVHDDQMNAMTLMGRKDIFSIQVVLDRNQDIYAVTAGDIRASFDAAVGKAEEVFVIPVDCMADIVIAVAGAPLDVTLYQAHKAIENTKGVLAEGGVMILVAQCGEGMGNDTFVRLLGQSDTPADVIEKVSVEYKLGYHKAAKLAELIQCNDVYVVSALPAEAVENIFMKPYNDVQKALDDAIAAKGSNARVLIVLDACVTVPSHS